MLQTSALFRYIQSNSIEYAGKAIELRDSISGWLEYVPQSFPHYTRHTIEHSEEIISQASSILFVDGDPEQPVVNLSSIEAYVLIAASYLHDAGMVTSDEQKAQILQSPEWKEWAEEGGGGTSRNAQIDELRSSNMPPDEALRNFLADIQLRFLVAEFVRNRHHFRSGRLVQQHQSELGRFAFDDPVLIRTIADICIAHGLNQHELQDDARYPDRRTIRGELINVRFISLVLRMADLLDMSIDRACPLLLNAASPLPSGSLAHWSQYQRITHRLIAHDRIEIHAECKDHLEHRYLQDWCSWLVDESRHARALIAHSHRHDEWVPPIVTIDGSDPSIKIIPSPEAKYVPSRWRLDLDPDIVLDRLVYDLHSNSKAFIRELLQNSLDAVRCRLFLQLTQESPDFTGVFTEVDKRIRDQYPISIELGEREFLNPLSGEEEIQQVFTIHDDGIGMDKRIIERYFLQIGRSFYSSEEFRREFGFFATSQFGLGFLSVFAVSDHVVVDTYKAEAEAPIRLLLTGPRNYLLSEEGSRSTPGTSIEIVLRENFESGELTVLIERWCKRVEFPIGVNDLGKKSIIESESSDQFESSVPDVIDSNSQLSVVSFPVERPGIEGELYVFVHSTKEGDSWADWAWARSTYPSLHPQASAPELPGDLVCINGIAVRESRSFSQGPMASRLDLRHPKFQQSLTRTDIGRSHAFGPANIPEVEARWEEILTRHLSESPFAQGDESWIYIQRLVRLFQLSRYWEDVHGAIEYFDGGQPKLTSLNEFMSISEFTSTFTPYVYSDQANQSSNSEQLPLSNYSNTHLSESHIRRLSHRHRKMIFETRSIKSVSTQSGSIKLEWVSRKSLPPIAEGLTRHPVEVVELPFPETVGFSIHKTTDDIYSCALLNAEHPVIQWLLNIKDPCLEYKFGLTPDQYHRLVRFILKPVRYGGLDFEILVKYLDGWRDLEELPGELHPPEVELKTESFETPSLGENLPEEQ